MIDRYIDTEVAKFRYVRIGTGSPVLLLPGSGGWRLTFHTMAEVLAERHTVVALDPPGQGLTEVLDPDFGYDADAIARAIAVFLDAVRLERVAIVGHSWGGGFGLRFAELNPDRVTRLALLGPGGLDVKDVWEFRLLRLPVVGELAVRLRSRASVRHLLRKSFVHRERIPNQLVGEVVREMRSRPRRDARLTDMLRVERSVSWAETEADLHLVRAPVLLVWGNRDRYFPVRLIDRFITRLPTVEHHVLSNCGHSLPDDCPKQTYALLSTFLRRNQRPAVREPWSLDIPSDLSVSEHEKPPWASRK
ncbi:MAG TPA: alpha/beta hydrolase [Jiangellaceae bacterium]|nr:alpha/beta hydrolase [Jiangellaceae bacterium]